MPTYECLPRFWRDLKALTPAQQKQFRKAVQMFVQGLEAKEFPKGLRVHRLQGTLVWSLTWAPDGRATFQYGSSQSGDDVHVIWRRIGSHAIYRQP